MRGLLYFLAGAVSTIVLTYFFGFILDTVLGYTLCPRKALRDSVLPAGAGIVSFVAYLVLPYENPWKYFAAAVALTGIPVAILLVITTPYWCNY